jgi:uncharacterized protein (TIGR02145 family)
MKKIILMIVLIAFPFILKTQTLKDLDGNLYKTVKINTQIWMSENLNVSHFLNGDTIPETKTPEDWEMAGIAKKPAWCYYNNDTTNTSKYQKLYNWYAIKDPRGLAPEGWHIPSNTDWMTLVKFCGTVDVAGGKLKSKSGWTQNGDNISGFTGLPGGNRSQKGDFSGIKIKGQFWSSSEDMLIKDQAYSVMLIYSSIEALYIKANKGNGFSVRCVKNQ